MCSSKAIGFNVKEFLYINYMFVIFSLPVMFGSWFDHVKGWLNAEDKGHIMYIAYEEMIMVRFRNSVSSSDPVQSHCPVTALVLFVSGPEGRCVQTCSVPGETSGQ